MIPAIALDLISESQSGKATTAANLWNALGHNALYGIKSIAGRVVTFYGGNIVISGEPTPIASQALTLDASDTVYVYSTAAGVFTKTTSLPSGWPGPLAAGAVAMYEFVTTATAVDIDASINYVPSTPTPGDPGDQGAQGPEGSDFAGTRKRVLMAIGNGSTGVSSFGWDTLSVVGTATARTASSSSLRESIPYLAYLSASSAGSAAQIHSSRPAVYRGDSAGRGGFTVSFRFCLESALSPANHRSFIGLFPVATIGNVEPDTLTNMVGIGSLAGDANFSIMHNDNAGTATKVALGANFPARATNNVYEAVLECAANGSSINYTVTNLNTGDVASSSLSTNLPVNTAFMTPVLWVNNGSTASQTAIGLMQAVCETRY